MGNKIGQVEIPITPAYKKEVKKERIRKMRRWMKNKLDFVPMYNRFTGYS